MRATPLALALCCFSLALGAPALANDEVCDGVFTNRTFDDTVIVPGGATCTLDRCRVQGDVKVFAGGALTTVNGSVRGNIQTDEARYVNLTGTRVGGNVQIKKTFDLPPDLDANVVCGLVINADLQLQGNVAAFDVGCGGGNKVGGNLQIEDSNVPSGAGDAIAVTNNVVAGDLQFVDNDARGRGFDISDNRVRQNLQCFDNDPAPMGAGNVAGDAAGQCESLTTERPGGGFGGGGDDDFTCDGAFERRRFDNVIVPGGATCSLTKVRVKGNIQVAAGGALFAEKVWVRGNIQTDEAAWVQVLLSRVRGNVQIDKTSGTPPEGGPNQVCKTTMGGSLQVTKNTAPFELGCEKGNRMRGNLQVVDNEIPGDMDEVVISVQNNKVRGDLQFQNNQTGGVFDISDNRVRQNLQCVDNEPAPTGSGNRAGDLEDQCSGLGR